MNNSQPFKNVSKPKRGARRVGTLAVASLFALWVFGLGYGFGSGKILISSSGIRYTTTSKNGSPSGSDLSVLPSDLDYSSVEKVYDALKKDYDGELDAAQLLEGIKSGLAKATGDPYTEYFNPTEAKEFNSELNGSFVGIGAELGKDNDRLVVVSPIEGFPAAKAGIRPRDVIVEINGEPAYDLSVSDAVKKIRGDIGTKVTLKVVRGGNEQLTFEMIRETITIPSVQYEVLEGNIGYLRISRFSEDTAKLAKEAATSFVNKDVKGVVVDMRGNPGGLLDAAVDVSSLWLDNDKLILQEKRGNTVVKSFKAKGQPILKGVKTAVLIDEGSASASEITAGALSDNGAAKLVGMKSYGKGSVQQLVELGSALSSKDSGKEGLLKVTIARWYTPAGKNIDKEGIKPEFEVKLTEEQIKNKEDAQKAKAIELVR